MDEGLGDSLELFFAPSSAFPMDEVDDSEGEGVPGTDDGGAAGGPKFKKARPQESDMALSAAEQKASKSRERNREHARNTRMRKKAFVETLQQTLKETEQELAAEKDRAAEATMRCNPDLDRKHDAWWETLDTMFSYRAAGEMDPIKWAEILEPDCKITMPITPYRSFDPCTITATRRRVLVGVEGMISDTKSLRVCVDSLSNVGRDGAGGSAGGGDAVAAALAEATYGGPQQENNNKKPHVELRYYVDTRKLHTSEAGLMATWMLRSLNAVASGARREVAKHGTVTAEFSARGRISALEMTFDGIAFWQQLQQALGKEEEFTVVPNTLQMALRNTSEARVITTAEPPFIITHVNDAWVNLCGFTPEESCGKPLAMLQGPETDLGVVKALCADAVANRASSMNVTNYRKSGEKFSNFLRIYPLVSEGSSSSSSNASQATSHFLGVLQRTDDTNCAGDGLTSGGRAVIVSA